MSDPSRAILLTPPGPAAIAVVRVAGHGVARFLKAHFRGTPKPLRPVHGDLVDGDRLIDDPVVVLGADESFADINLHGGPWVVRSVLDLVQRAGFEIGSLDADIDSDAPIEREILTHLPHATTELAIRSLLAQKRAWEPLQRGPIDPAEAKRILADRSLHWLLRPPRVAIVGAANVGKSTLANQLFAQKRSITADLPGTTRDWVGETANLNGLAVQLLDTPGLRQTCDPIEAAAIERSREQIRAADLVVLVLDASRALQSEQAPLLQRFKDALRVLNKCDLPRKYTVQGALEVVATSGGGVDRLIAAILSRFDNPQIDPERPRCWTERQRALLRGAENTK